MGFSLRRPTSERDPRPAGPTRIRNRRQFDHDIAHGVAVTDQTTASLLVDVDHFANHLRRHGADTAEGVLEQVSWLIMATVRTTDIVYRPGHSTFCVLLPATSDAAAMAVADRIRRNVERSPALAEGEVTVSIGVACGPGAEVADTVDRADRALLAGASRGRNRVFGDRADAVADRP